MNLSDIQLNQDDFNAAKGNDFSLLPAGNYIAQIIESVVKENKNGGRRLAVTFQIVDGEFANRLIFENLNLWNDNDDAVRIARQTLAKICNATGRTHVNDSTELHYQPMQIKVGVREDKTGQYGPQNTIKGFAALTGNHAPSAAPVPPQTAQQPAAQAAPWARR